MPSEWRVYPPYCRHHSEAHTASSRESAPWQDEKKKLAHSSPYVEQLHSVHIVRGSRGSVLLAEPMFSENIEATDIVYMGKFNNLMRNSARYFCADKTNIFLHAMMIQVFRNPRGCALDPTHLAFAVDAASWGKKTDISTHVRRILSKFHQSSTGGFGGGLLHRRTNTC